MGAVETDVKAMMAANVVTIVTSLSGGASTGTWTGLTGCGVAVRALYSSGSVTRHLQWVESTVYVYCYYCVGKLPIAREYWVAESEVVRPGSYCEIHSHVKRHRLQISNLG